MSTTAASSTEFITWERQPQAEAFLQAVVAEFMKSCTAAVELAERMRNETGTRFPDWIGHITLPPDDPRKQRAIDAGYVVVSDGDGLTVLEHPGGMFPTFVICDLGHREMEVAIKVESVADFFAAQQIQGRIEGEPLSDIRVGHVAKGNGAVLTVIERHGTRSFDPPDKAPAHAIRRLVHLERLRSRRRDFEDDTEGFAHANRLIDAAIADLGVDLTCDLFFAAEREYWQRRNRAAQAQKTRQDKLGLGWANHDHHTYRSSREHFRLLIATWEKLGFKCRERFYAGREAGWGAQVMEQPVTGIITFNDVDLSPDELMGDFSHEGLEAQAKVGTVGLWCALHGEAFLQAGMHHLEAQFDFESLRTQLEHEAHIKTMKPFTNFNYLKQAFTEGERWPVAEQRLVRAVQRGYITAAHADQFRAHGALGSHLENLERNEGFKGFNQIGVSEIITATDPRRHAAYRKATGVLADG